MVLPYTGVSYHLNHFDHAFDDVTHCRSAGNIGIVTVGIVVNTERWPFDALRAFSRKGRKTNIDFRDVAIQELFDSAEWQEFCVSDGLTCDGMLKGEELANFHATQVVAHKKLIEQVGADAITGE